MPRDFSTLPVLDEFDDFDLGQLLLLILVFVGDFAIVLGDIDQRAFSLVGWDPHKRCELLGEPGIQGCLHEHNIRVFQGQNGQHALIPARIRAEQGKRRFLVLIQSLQSMCLLELHHGRVLIFLHKIDY